LARAAYDAEPQWSEMPSKRGLDPLGMQAGGIVVYQDLLPGISNVTLRMRYYGLYAWLSDTYARKAGKTDSDTWRRWVRRTEALYALVAADSKTETGGVAGVDWAGKRLAIADSDVIEFATATETKGPNLYLQQGMGVFGGAYGSQLRDLGVLGAARDHDLPVPSETTGLPLALAFRAAIGEEAETLAISAIETASIARQDLIRLRGMLPSAIVPGSTESLLYGDILFATPDSKGDRRRDTLLLILAVARLMGKGPDPADVRWTLFGAPAGTLGEPLEPARLAWEIYHTHDLMQLAFAGLLRHCLDVLGAAPVGLEASVLVETAADQAVKALSELEGITIAPTTCWAEMVASSLTLNPRALEKALSGLRAPSPAPPQTIAGALRLIANVQARVEERPDLIEELPRRFRMGPFGRALTTELSFLQTRGDMTLMDLTRELIAQRVINRHAQVAAQKFVRQRDYTFLFEQAEGRLRRRGVYDPVLTTPRLGSAITFLRDLGLLGDAGPTAAGLERLDAAA